MMAESRNEVCEEKVESMGRRAEGGDLAKSVSALYPIRLVYI